MVTISDAALLDAWERGRTQSNTLRAVTLLTAAWPDLPADSILDLPIGKRDARLLSLREALFGPDLRGLTECPQCTATVEMEFAVSQVLQTDAGETEEGPSEPMCVQAEGYQLEFRLPTTRDLLAITAGDLASEDLAQEALLSRCILSSYRAGEPVTAVADLPQAAVEAVTAAMEQCDPQADVRLALTCPACGHAWSERFDIVAFLWSEITACAARLLRDIHTIASAYGWSEAQIVAVPAARRRRYIDAILEEKPA